MSELYDITEGTFDEASGRAELPRVTGKPEVFVIAGGGNGAPVYRRLQREKIPFSTGILWKNDIDYPVACALAAKVIAEEAFETVTAETLAAAKREIDQCGRVLCLFPDFGAFNQADREQWRENCHGKSDHDTGNDVRGWKKSALRRTLPDLCAGWLSHRAV